MLVGIFREAERGLIKVASVNIPDSTTLAQIETVAWREYTRTTALPNGDYHVMKLGRRFRYEETRSFRTVDLGPVTS